MRAQNHSSRWLTYPALLSQIERQVHGSRIGWWIQELTKNTHTMTKSIKTMNEASFEWQWLFHHRPARKLQPLNEHLKIFTNFQDSVRKLSTKSFTELRRTEWYNFRGTNKLRLREVNIPTTTTFPSKLPCQKKGRKSIPDCTEVNFCFHDTSFWPFDRA